MSSANYSEAVHARVYGRVQGVGFRYFVQSRALELDLTGWVRNEPDGKSVELLVEGPREAIDRFLAVIGQGPPGARVERVQTEWITAQGQPHRFEIRHR